MYTEVNAGRRGPSWPWGCHRRLSQARIRIRHFQECPYSRAWFGRSRAKRMYLEAPFRVLGWLRI